jgi:dihydrofolate reductase
MIWAQANGGVIGHGGDMPWYLPEDFAHFKAKTLGTPVIMGSATWRSLPEAFRPLPGRTNIVLTRDPHLDAPGAHLAGDVDQAIALAGKSAQLTGSSTIWIIGGGKIYSQFMNYAEVLEVTHINLDVVGDTHAPHIAPQFTLTHREPETGWNESRTGLHYAFATYTRRGDAA